MDDAAQDNQALFERLYFSIISMICRIPAAWRDRVSAGEVLVLALFAPRHNVAWFVIVSASVVTSGDCEWGAINCRATSVGAFGPRIPRAGAWWGGHILAPQICIHEYPRRPGRWWGD